MHIELKAVKIRDLVKDYVDDGEGGVQGWGGNLDIRPPYQREFVYNDKQRNAVIDTVTANYPLNVMYFASRDDGTFEVMDGQQRILSICKYVNGDFSHNQRSFGNLPSDLRDQIYDYELQVYQCTGTPSEKLAWFRVINVAGARLTEQELRNAVFHGPFVTDAKRWFSKTSCPASIEGEGYVSGTPIRQELLELALKWVCLRDGLSEVEVYMDKVRSNPNATDLWSYYLCILTWAKSTFPKVRKPMKSVNWGELYKNFGSTFPNSEELEQRVSKLLIDDEVTDKAGIYAFVLDGNERHLSLRAFSEAQKIQMHEKQLGRCARPSISGHQADMVFDLSEMEADHIKPWSDGGITTLENGQMLCKMCNRRKSDN
jgi:hypothetical protein